MVKSEHIRVARFRRAAVLDERFDDQETSTWLPSSRPIPRPPTKRTLSASRSRSASLKPPLTYSPSSPAPQRCAKRSDLNQIRPKVTRMVGRYCVCAWIGHARCRRDWSRWRADAEVLEPAELRPRIAEIARQVAARYADPRSSHADPEPASRREIPLSIVLHDLRDVDVSGDLHGTVSAASSYLQRVRCFPDRTCHE